MTYAQAFILQGIEEKIKHVKSISHPNNAGHRETIADMQKFLDDLREQFNKEE